MAGRIIQAVTFDGVVTRAAKTIFYGAVTCWWTDDPGDLSKHPISGLPCDPRGGVLYQTNNVADFFRRVKLNAREGVYGKHGLDAFMAAHHKNCKVSETDDRPTCYTTWWEYNDIIDRQLAKPVVPALLRTADLSTGLGPIPEKTVQHEPNPRVLGGEGGEEEDEGGSNEE